ncbi:MAG TPA: 50S ribosomal protein L4 [Opitutales bacterium]|nr:50S ribosomal protein L4 [Opitutales bacterium]
MKLKVYTKDASSSKETEFPQFEIFEGRHGQQALKEVIVAYQANARQGTRSTKTRAEVSGGGRKPWRQKGTGNARVGSTRSPIWTGGGRAFGPKPRDYSKKINRKVRTLAMKRIFSDRAQRGEIEILEELEITEPKTKLLHDLVRTIAPQGRVLLVEDGIGDTLRLASRNLAEIDLIEAGTVNTLDLASYRKIIITRKALERLGTRLNGASK